MAFSPDFTATGTNGATAASRYAGATASGAPTYGAFSVGDWVVDRSGVIWICTTAGIPGSWTSAAALALPLTGGTLTGNLALAAGTATLAPLTFPAGTVLTTATAGDAEFDGTAFYLTSVAASRQVVDTEQIQILSSANTLANNTNAQAIFNATANGALTVAATTTYEFEMVLNVTGLNASSHTINLGFALGGSATLTGIMYNAVTATAAGGATSSFVVTANAATAITAANTGTVLQAYIRGTIRVNASPSNAGTITPQITQVTASAAASVGTNSFIRLWPIGSNAVTNVGDWS